MYFYLYSEFCRFVACIPEFNFLLGNIFLGVHEPPLTPRLDANAPLSEGRIVRTIQKMFRVYHPMCLPRLGIQFWRNMHQNPTSNMNNMGRMQDLWEIYPTVGAELLTRWEFMRLGAFALFASIRWITSLDRSLGMEWMHKSQSCHPMKK